MTFKHGKFYEGDKVVPLEFGNKEQIKLIELVQAFKKDGVIFIGKTFNCPCGRELKFDDNGDCICLDCSTKYELDNSSDLPIVKGKFI